MNSGPRKSAGSSDLIPGIAASVTLVVMFLLLKFIPLWIGIGLAIGVYFGIKFLLPSPQPDVVPVESTQSILVEVKQLAEWLPPGSARVQFRNIADIAEGLLRYGEANPDKALDSQFIVRQYLESLRTGIRRYKETMRYTPDSAQQSQQTLTELLETVYTSLKRLHGSLVEKETADLTGDLRALNQTLQEMDRVWVNLGEKKE